MKKLLVLAALITLFTSAIFAAPSNMNLTTEKNEDKWSSLSYYNVPIVKVLDGKEAYVVIYQKNKIGVGTTVIPKKWANGTPDNPRKLKFRNCKNPNSSFMTVIKKNGEFSRVVLTIPMKKNNALWGIADYSKRIEGADKETLEELDLF